MSYILTCHDFSRHQFGDPRPPVERKYFGTLAEAEAALRDYRAAHPDHPGNHLAGVSETKRKKPSVTERQGNFGFLEVDAPARRFTD